MTFPSDKLNMERMGREYICINPNHETLTVYTFEQIPKCPICDNVMARVLKSPLTGESVKTSREE